MSEDLEEDTKPDVHGLGLLSTGSEFGNENKPTIGNQETLTKEEDSGVSRNDNAVKEETSPFMMINVIKTEPGTDEEGCSCVKSETEEYYNSEGDVNTLYKQESCIDDNTVIKQESGNGDDDLVKKEEGFEDLDYMGSVDRYVEGEC